MTTLGSLRLDLGLNLASLASDLGKTAHMVDIAFKRMEGAARSADRFIGRLTAGVAGVSFTVGMKNALDYADRLNDLSQSSGIAVADLSKLDYAARQNGSGLESLADGLKNFNKSIAGAIAGTRDQAAAFQLMEVPLKDSEGRLRKTDELLKDVADRFSGYEDGANKAALAQAVFGKSGADLIPLLNQGAQGFDEAAAAAERLGIVIDQDTAAAADKFNDRLVDAQLVVRSYFTAINAGLLPVMTAMTQSFLDTAAQADKYDRIQRSAAAGGQLLATAGAVISEGFKSVGKVLAGVASQVKLLIAGDWAGVMAADRAFQDDLFSGWQETSRRLRAIWDENTASIKSNSEKQEGVKRQLSAAPNLDAWIANNAALKKSSDDATKALLKQLEALDKIASEGMERISLELADRTLGPVEAALARFDQQNAELIAALEDQGRSGDIDRVNQLRGMIEQQERFNQVAAEYGRIQDALALSEERIRNSQEVGALSEIEALRQIGAERVRSLEVMSQQLAAAEALSASITDPEQLAAIARMRAEMEGLALQADLLGQKFQSMLTDSATTFFETLLTGTATAREAFSALFADIARQMARLLAQQAAQKLVGFLFNAVAGSLAGPAGAVGAQTFGGFNASAGVFGAGGVGSSFDLSNAPGLAKGGPARAGGLYEVAENGPELLSIGGRSYLMMGRDSGQVTPSVPAAASASAPSIRIVNAFDTRVIGDFLGSADGEKVFLNAVSRHAQSIRSLVAAS